MRENTGNPSFSTVNRYRKNRRATFRPSKHDELYMVSTWNLFHLSFTRFSCENQSVKWKWIDFSTRKSHSFSYVSFWAPEWACFWPTLLVKMNWLWGFSCVHLLCIHSIGNFSLRHNFFLSSILLHCHLLWMKCLRMSGAAMTASACDCQYLQCIDKGLQFNVVSTYIMHIWTGDNSR